MLNNFFLFSFFSLIIPKTLFLTIETDNNNNKNIFSPFEGEEEEDTFTYDQCLEFFSGIKVHCKIKYRDPYTSEERCSQDGFEFESEIPLDCYNQSYNVSLYIENLNPPRREYHIVDLSDKDFLLAAGIISYDGFMMIDKMKDEKWGKELFDYCIKIYTKIGSFCEKMKVDKFGNEYCVSIKLKQKGPKECENFRDMILEEISRNNELKQKFIGDYYSKDMIVTRKTEKKNEKNKNKNKKLREEISLRECIEYSIKGDIIICLKYD